MGAPRKVDDETLAVLDDRLRCRHQMIDLLVGMGLNFKALADDLGVHPETVRRRDYQLHGYSHRDPDIVKRLRNTLNLTHLARVTPD